MDAAGGDAGSITIEIGTGQDMFEPLAEGASVMLTEGPQAAGRLDGYHIWSAVRVRGLDPAGVLVEFVLADESGSEQARQARMLNLQPTGDAFDAYGIAPRIADCCAVASRPVEMVVTVTARNGSGSDRRRVMAGPCIEGATGRSRCP